MSSSWSSKHSARVTISGRVELTPSSSRPTFLEFRVCLKEIVFFEGNRVFSGPCTGPEKKDFKGGET